MIRDSSSVYIVRASIYEIFVETFNIIDYSCYILARLKENFGRISSKRPMFKY